MMEVKAETVDLRPLRVELLKIYSVFRRLCEKYGFRFFAVCGTAIGAVRHHGFIPWDDDFDVAMPYSDYMKFIKIAKEELPANMRIVTGKNINAPCFGYGKVYNIDRATLERIEKETGTCLPQGIYIDIFPLCGIPRMTLPLRFRLAYCHLRQYGLQRRKFGRIAGKIAQLAGRFVLLFPGPRDFDALMNFKRKVSGTVSFDDAEYVSVFDWTTFKFAPSTPQHDGRNSLKASWFRAARMVPFEDTEVPIPIGCHEMLAAAYGDYMRLPPVEQRVPTHKNEKIAPWRFGDILDVDP